jgi:hypothetical protein
MHKKYMLIAMLLMITPMVLSTGVFAGKEVKEIISFDNPAYSKHKEAIAVFNHKKHSAEYYDTYPELYDSACGECHHDKDNKKLVDLKEGEEVQNCIECHKKADYIKGKAGRGLSKEQKRENHGNALHDNCKDCHKKYNKARKLKPGKEGYAPNTCVTCHDKDKK